MKLEFGDYVQVQDEALFHDGADGVVINSPADGVYTVRLLLNELLAYLDRDFPADSLVLIDFEEDEETGAEIV